MVNEDKSFTYLPVLAAAHQASRHLQTGRCNPTLHMPFYRGSMSNLK
jgi:hypothetical protein